MAKRKKSKPIKNKKQSKKDELEQENGLKRSVLKEILAIILVTIGVFIILALVGVAGSLGTWVLQAIKFVIGQSVYMVPVALFGVAFMLFAQEKYPLKGYNIIGILSFFICLSTILQAVLAPSSSLDISTIGQYGGVVGYGIYAVMSPLLNRWVVIFIFTMLLIISVIVSANARLKQIIAKIFSPLRKNKDEDVEAEGGFKINNPTELPIKGTIGDDKSKDQPKAEAGPIVSSTDKEWKYPSLDLLEATTTQSDPGDAKRNGSIIKATFDDFGYDVKMGVVNVGPTVSQYTLKPPTGVNLSKFNALDRNLALALSAEQVRIEAPIPGKSLVGVEVPNIKRAQVRLKDILASDSVKGNKSKLNFVLGRDVNGEVMTSDLDTAPHLLIAGSTGTGKSVMINTLLLSLLYRNSPSEMKLVLVDPKRVELSLYDDIPHLLCPVIYEPDQAISALKWSVAEMERRLRLLHEHHKRDIGEYNAQKGVDKMPYIVVVIDEVADLMQKARKDMDMLIAAIAAKARASGIHLVLATQRPSVDVITGVIKNNVPTRIALTVASQNDSRTIIDNGDAEKLLGKGDMLFKSPTSLKLKRVQGVLVDNSEVTKVVKFLKDQKTPEYNDEVLAQAVKIKGLASSLGGDDGDDAEVHEAAEIVIQAGKASASLLQRRMRVGYAKAARLIDMLEEKGIVGPPDGARPRQILVDSVGEINGGDSESE